uniref:type II toxin-antitoxin system antitoxin DNA ADP-ribosyl glycohydrolase DarG n=1 Tax=Clostridium sp. TaxID=1506 RepID=UPI002637D35F
MIVYTTGDLLKSKAEALVNTVNCEGYMGKGIAYQFKLEYPENNESYIKACKTGALRVGKLHYYTEKGKIVINFPTKDKWRAKSKIEYIELGLDELILLINRLNIKTIAIPPLGSGNGGLIWSEVKQLIEKKLSVISNRVEIMIYEPSQNYISLPVEEPKLSTSGLILMDIKGKLRRFDTLRLQKTAYFINIFSGENYFKFGRHKYGPYDNAIAIISKNIKEYQKYHNVKNTEEAYRILYKKIVSEKVENKLKELEPFIKKSTEFVNSISNNKELECLATVTYLIEEKNGLSEDEIINGFKSWSEDKANKYSE